MEVAMFDELSSEDEKKKWLFINVEEIPNQVLLQRMHL